MTTWKDVPYLFANGNFKIKVESEYNNNQEEIFEFIGVEGVTLILFKNGQTVNLISDYCTLIARPVSDMTDDELYKCEDLWHDAVYNYGEYCVSAKEALQNQGEFDLPTFLYLISIGVYPFDQHDFETETVIDINTL